MVNNSRATIDKSESIIDEKAKALILRPWDERIIKKERINTESKKQIKATYAIKIPTIPIILGKKREKKVIRPPAKTINIEYLIILLFKVLNLKKSAVNIIRNPRLIPNQTARVVDKKSISFHIQE